MDKKANIGRITYEDKIDHKIQGEDERYKITAQNMNEIKDVFNGSAEMVEEALDMSNETNELIQQKIEDGSFVPDFNIGEVETVEPGGQASASIDGNAKNPILNLAIPMGNQGVQGIQGIQGLQGIKGDDGKPGAQGPQGIKGDKGDKGDRGDSGVTAPLNGFFTLYVDSKGDLYARTAGTAEKPPFRYDSTTGNLYWEN